MRKRWHGCISTFSAITEKRGSRRVRRKAGITSSAAASNSDCSLYYTEGVLKNPVGKYYQLSYAQESRRIKNLHAYYDQHRAVRQNISLLYQELKKAMLLQEDQSFADADHGILQPARMWKVGRSQNADLFRLEQRRNSLDLSWIFS